MKAILLPIAAVAALSLAACENKPETVTSTAPDPMASQLANAAPVELPPALRASKTFRCKDNSLFYVDFFQGDKQANVRAEANGTPIQLKAENAGDPLTGGGYTVVGDEKSITLTAPGKGSQKCNA